jgi:hypothetical protein
MAGQGNACLPSSLYVRLMQRAHGRECGYVPGSNPAHFSWRFATVEMPTDLDRHPSIVQLAALSRCLPTLTCVHATRTKHGADTTAATAGRGATLGEHRREVVRLGHLHKKLAAGCDSVVGSQIQVPAHTSRQPVRFCCTSTSTSTSSNKRSTRRSRRRTNSKPAAMSGRVVSGVAVALENEQAMGVPSRSRF